MDGAPRKNTDEQATGEDVEKQEAGRKETRKSQGTGSLSTSENQGLHP